MKRKLESSLNLLLMILIVTTLLVTIDTNISRGISRNNENFFQAEVERNNVDLLNFFDVTDFTNTSHEINVSRVITANPFGYTTSYTKIHLYLSENASQPINAFNYTKGKPIIDKIKLLQNFDKTKNEAKMLLDIARMRNIEQYLNDVHFNRMTPNREIDRREEI